MLDNFLLEVVGSYQTGELSLELVLVLGLNILLPFFWLDLWKTLGRPKTF